MAFLQSDAARKSVHLVAGTAAGGPVPLQHRLPNGIRFEHAVSVVQIVDAEFVAGPLARIVRSGDPLQVERRGHHPLRHLRLERREERTAVVEMIPAAVRFHDP